MAKVIQASIPACGICGIVYQTEEIAAQCCTCDKCGLEVPKTGNHFTRRHRECQSKADKEAAVKLFEAGEKLETWDGPVVIDRDHYFQDLDSYVEYLEDTLEPGEEWPSWVNTCIIEPFPKLSLDELIEGLIEQHGLEEFDSADLDVPVAVMDALESAIEAFNKATGDSKFNVAWHENPRQFVRVPSREAA